MKFLFKDKLMAHEGKIDLAFAAILSFCAIYPFFADGLDGLIVFYIPPLFVLWFLTKLIITILRRRK